VVWTDTLQSFSMVLGVLVVTVLGTIEAGGFNAVIQKASESNRIELFKSAYFHHSPNLCAEK
jgi:Na+/proline symporter